MCQLADFDKIKLVEEYLIGITQERIHTGYFVAIDSKESAQLSTSPLGPELGNPFPKPPTAAPFGLFPGDFQDADGARLQNNSLTKGKYEEYSICKSVTLHLYDVIIRQFECLHHSSVSHSLCKVVAESLVSLLS